MVIIHMLHHKANCNSEAYRLIKYFKDQAYTLTEIRDLDESGSEVCLTCKLALSLFQNKFYFYFQKLARNLIKCTKVISSILMAERPGKEKEMATEALSMCMQLISSIVKMKKILPKNELEKYLSQSVEPWCAVRIPASKVLDDVRVF